ncbi:MULTISPECIES: hydantoinase/oxoprolinase family protein [unclassified Amycolatopsis]|uniref:hydantoinase/oxoprolinase family protein n=1 Tax=unclassified Amycolatopsis TaxID=2618356 RepID=UPI002874F633|nr:MULTISPECIES: hydantoinase/oxoprolinase family protein [unclassified Amycolatopsis]MDS0137235.1 hydantoinase/oxoprolinase family protein [Amycolatopsis sp. 505]MDS0141430.1 hydantoinase/oxoprolinase family protein [Amycolatopsis sp. CM201R]
MRIGVDIGGTFTDLCAVDETGIVAVGKVLTTHDEPARAVEEGLAALLPDLGAVEQVVHGTTLVTNALIERTGSRTALLATAGFRDVLEMRREHRYELYDLHLELPAPLVPRHLRFDVPERILADGSVHTGLDEQYVTRLGRELADRGIEAVAVCFLHAFTNPAHERRTAELLAEVAPSLRVALSSDVVPEIREFERASTTVANVYVQDLTERYLRDLEQRLRRLGITRAPHIMLSNGGLASVDTAARHPIRILESGPAGGALAAAAIGPEDLLAFDMGGTTAKLCLIAGGTPLVTHQFEVDRKYRLLPGSGLPVRVPVTDMIEIGVGGGSIARIDALGLLTVGPDSAGSEPGPVCYDRGGTEPTVTDADLVLGYLDPGYFLGGGMRLDAEAARAVLRRKIADPLGVSVEEAAWGIHTSVNEDMANAARVHAVERGHDPAKLPMYTFGGAGPVHGVGVARALGAPSVVAPPAAGVLSAAGFLTAPLAFDFVRSARAAVHDLTWDQVDALFAEMEAEGAALLAKSGVDEVTHRRVAEMRYAGQGYEIRVPVHDGPWPGTLIEEFTSTYRALYRRTGPEVGVEVLNWRVVSSGPAPEVTLRLEAASAGEARKGSRPAWFPAAGGFVDTAVFDRYRLEPGARVDGPAIVEERESTVVVPPGASCVVRADGALEVTV